MRAALIGIDLHNGRMAGYLAFHDKIAKWPSIANYNREDSGPNISLAYLCMPDGNVLILSEQFIAEPNAMSSTLTENREEFTLLRLETRIKEMASHQDFLCKTK